MKKRSAIRTHHKPHFYIIFGILAITLGIIGTLIITKVVAQTSNIIYACAAQNTGILRMVSSSDQCHPNETSVSWNQEGPAGPPGPSGNGTGLPFFCAFPCNMTPYADKFKGKDFSGAQMFQTNFADADLTGVIFKGGFILSTRFNNANLTNADFSDIKDVPGWDVVRNDKFIGANLTSANFSNSNFQGSDFSHANLQNTNLSNAILKFDNFSGAQNMSTANISGTTWQGVTCPDGTNSDNNGNTCVGHF